MYCSPGVVSPGPRVVSPGLRVHTYTYVCGRLFLERGIFTHLLPVVNPRAKRLHTTGGSTFSPGEQDIGRNDLLNLPFQ